MIRDVDVDDAATLVREQHQDEQHAASERGYGKEIHRRRRGDMISQKRSPRL